MQKANQKSAAQKTVRALKVTGIGLAVVLVLGFFSGWLSMSTDKDENQNAWDLTLSLNKDEVKETFVWMGLVAKHAKETAQTLSEMETVEGTVAEVNSGDKSITVLTTEEESMVVQVDESSKILIEGEEVEFSRLAKNQSVRVYFREQEDGNFAGKVRIIESAS